LWKALARSWIPSDELLGDGNIGWNNNKSLMRHNIDTMAIEVQDDLPEEMHYHQSFHALKILEILHQFSQMLSIKQIREHPQR
jgi:hypothetical protein